MLPSTPTPRRPSMGAVDSNAGLIETSAVSPPDLYPVAVKESDPTKSVSVMAMEHLIL